MAVTAFEKWLLANSRQMSSIENAARSLTLFAPGQNNDVEIISEAASAGLQLLSLYHDELAARVLAEEYPDKELSSHAKYIGALLNTSKTYKTAAYTLSVVRCTELLIEMIARDRKGTKGRWQAVLSLESVKALLRIVMLFSSQRPLAYPSLHNREMDPEELSQLFGDEDEKAVAQAQKAVAEESARDLASTDQPVSENLLPIDAATKDQTWRMPRSGKKLAVNPIDIPSLLQSKGLKSEDLRRPLALVRKFVPLTLVGDIISILRPLIYALLAYKYRAHRANWRPWVIGIIIEFLGKKLSSDGYAGLKGGRRQMSSVEQAQLQSKTSSLWWWALRGAMYETKTRPLIAGIASKFANIPLLNIVNVLVEDYLYLLDNYHFASASY